MGTKKRIGLSRKAARSEHAIDLASLDPTPYHAYLHARIVKYGGVDEVHIHSDKYVTTMATEMWVLLAEVEGKNYHEAGKKLSRAVRTSPKFAWVRALFNQEAEPIPFFPSAWYVKKVR
jgi:hypothetical protein